MDDIYEYMENLNAVASAETVDALTVTSVGLEGKLSMQLIVDSLRDYLELEPKQPFRFRQAYGWTRGSVSYAEQHNYRGSQLWSILMVRGSMSEAAFTVACKLDDLKVTRIDIAVDLQLTQQVQKLARKLYDTYTGKFEPKLIEGLTGGTLYCGDRETSGIYIRIYDKSPEYGKDLGHVWRFEVEFKKNKAPHVFGLLKEQGIGIAQDIVWTAIKSRGLPAPRIGQTVNLRAHRVALSTAEMKLAWLGRQVRPTVNYLRGIGKEREVYEQLGFDLLDLPQEFDKEGE